MMHAANYHLKLKSATIVHYLQSIGSEPGVLIDRITASEVRFPISPVPCHLENQEASHDNLKVPR